MVQAAGPTKPPKNRMSRNARFMSDGLRRTLYAPSRSLILRAIIATSWAVIVARPRQIDGTRSRTGPGLGVIHEYAVGETLGFRTLCVTRMMVLRLSGPDVPESR